MHRQSPTSYVEHNPRHPDQQEPPHPCRLNAFAFSPEPSLQWCSAAPDSVAPWPPPEPGSEGDLTPACVSRKPQLAVQLAESTSRFAWMLRSWMRPHFLDEDFLQRAEARYERFLRLRAAHPRVALVPAADIALLWHTHLGLSGEYEAACAEWLGPEAGPWEPEYLSLERGRMVVAYGMTAALYERMYDEPYSGPDTAWLPDMEHFPLLSPTNPLAFAAGRAFREFPLPDSETALRAAEMHLALCGGSVARLFPVGGREPPRSGAHALYAAWLTAEACGRFFDDYTCRRCCFTRSWSIRVATVERAAMVLVAIAHLRYLVDSSSHPFLLAITLRKGLWKPELFEEQQQQQRREEEHQQRLQERPSGGMRSMSGMAAHPAAAGRSSRSLGRSESQLSGMFAGSGFRTADPEAFVDHPSMAGLTALLESCAASKAPSMMRGGHKMQKHQTTPPLPRGVAPLWAILGAQGYAERPRKLFEYLWRGAVARGVASVMTYGEEELFYPHR
ncbi:hypothetical protein GPECTOR_12g496 [Gonium pectorale]|uniref:Uncharacterized protein n=1 Tax=Gonium pectorale TaxID=33097 RepID=A0A150GNW6_GONPE|nr:hypothetical protein GPECTOR_12g496 [Gonium pectorale]|eukprot:KXZ51533.1 hypothetical protein GPECTOR_12g496 [Gonium pectorale]